MGLVKIVVWGILGWGVILGGSWLCYSAWQDHKMIWTNAAITGQVVGYLNTQVASQATPTVKK